MIGPFEPGCWIIHEPVERRIFNGDHVTKMAPPEEVSISLFRVNISDVVDPSANTTSRTGDWGWVSGMGCGEEGDGAGVQLTGGVARVGIYLAENSRLENIFWR